GGGWRVVLRGCRTVRGGACSPPPRTAPGVPRCSAGPCGPHRRCAGVVALEGELDVAGRAVPVFPDLREQFGGGLVAVLVQQDHDICILFDRAGLAEVCDAGESAILARAVPVEL